MENSRLESTKDNLVFSYSPLKLASGDIRLLVLLPREGIEDVRCQIMNANFSSNPQYEALSYTWGYPRPVRHITLDGKEFCIRSNLWYALRALRHETKPRLLWIDALCINQLNTPERNHQVAQMSQIYKRAEMVLIWLGRPSLDDSQLFKLLNRPSQSPLSSSSFPGEKLWMLNALRMLCSKEYWQRLWIVQEVVLAAKIEMHCGGERVPWETVVELFHQLSAISNPIFDRKLLAIIHGGFAARLIRQSQETEIERLPLLDLVERYQHSICMDPLDKAFGLYSFARDCCSQATPTDYSKTSDEIHTAIFNHYLACHRNALTDLSLINKSRTLHRVLQVNFRFEPTLSLAHIRPIASKERCPDITRKTCIVRSVIRRLHVYSFRSPARNGMYRVERVALKPASEDHEFYPGSYDRKVSFLSTTLGMVNQHLVTHRLKNIMYINRRAFHKRPPVETPHPPERQTARERLLYNRSRQHHRFLEPQEVFFLDDQRGKFPPRGRQAAPLPSRHQTIRERLSSNRPLEAERAWFPYDQGGELSPHLFQSLNIKEADIQTAISLGSAPLDGDLYKAVFLPDIKTLIVTPRDTEEGMLICTLGNNYESFVLVRQDANNAFVVVGRAAGIEIPDFHRSSVDEDVFLQYHDTKIVGKKLRLDLDFATSHLLGMD